MVTLYDNLIRVEMKPHEPGHGPNMLQSKPALSTVKEMYRKILQTRMIKVALMVGVEVKAEMIVEAEVEVRRKYYRSISPYVSCPAASQNYSLFYSFSTS